MIQPLAFVEHFFRELATEVAAGYSHTGNMMQRDIASQIIGKGHDITRALIVHAVCGVVVHVHVIDRRQVKHVIDLPFELLETGCRHQSWRGDIAADNVEALCCVAIALRHGFKFFPRTVADQNMNLRFFAREQSLKQKFADETCCARYKIVHV